MIKHTTDREIIYRIDVCVNLIQESSDIAASMNISDELTGPARDEFDEFTTNVYAMLDYIGYEVTDVEYSHVVDSNSTYFTAYKRNESNEKDIKCLIFIRLSDHSMNIKRKKWQDKYWVDKAQMLKQPQDKTHQKWRFFNIVVDGVKYESYDAAISALEEKLKRI